MIWRVPRLPLVVVGLNYLRGDTFSHVISVAGVAVCLLVWTALFPRRLVLDDEGFTLTRVLARTRRVRWQDVDRFQAYRPSGLSARYACWFERDRRETWWNRRSADGWILPAFSRPGTSGTMSADELATFMSDRLMRRPAWSWPTAETAIGASDGDPFRSGTL